MKKILTIEEKRINHNKSAKKYYHLKRSRYIKPISTILMIDRNKLKVCGIYRIGSKKEFQLSYVGASVNCLNRLITHLSVLKENKHYNTLLQEFYNNYYPNDFTFEILFPCSKEQLKYYEEHFIQETNPLFNIRRYKTTYPKISIIRKKTDLSKIIKEAKNNYNKKYKRNHPEIQKNYNSKHIEKIKLYQKNYQKTYKRKQKS
jgi:hypothetical protein